MAIGFIIGLGAAGALALSGIRIVNQVDRGVVETFGKYTRNVGPGIRWVIPMVQRILVQNVTEKMADVKPRDMITKDNLNVNIDLQVYYKVKPDDKSVYNSIYNVDDFESQIISLAQTTARNHIGTMKFEEVNSLRSKLNDKIREDLKEQVDSWGVEIVRVELKEITPPENVQATMNEIIKAKNKKEAAVDFATAQETEADGLKRAAIKKAEGEKQALIAQAEGKAKAIELVAKAEAENIKLVNESAQKYFKGAAIDLKKLETAESALRNGTKYLIDSDKPLSVVLSDAAGIVPVKSK